MLGLNNCRRHPNPEAHVDQRGRPSREQNPTWMLVDSEAYADDDNKSDAERNECAWVERQL